MANAGACWWCGRLSTTGSHTALQQLNQLWDEPAERGCIVATFVERVDIGTQGLNVHYRVDGITGLPRELLVDRQEKPDDPRDNGSRDGNAPRPVPSREARRAEGDAAAHQRKTDNTLIKVLARALRWKRMLGRGSLLPSANSASVRRLHHPARPVSRGSRCSRRHRRVDSGQHAGAECGARPGHGRRAALSW